MIFKEFQGKKLSALGLGAMRLPTIDGDNNRIDEEKTAEMIDYAIKNGVNYFDTAWVYHGGQSETVLGKLLKKYPRESFYLADKFPGFDLENIKKVKEIFEKQLEKCQVEYFDFYLFHSLSESNVDFYLDPAYGILDYLLAQKKAGRIRHLGFSAHAPMATMKKFLQAYGEHMEFCQLQINWLDWEYQSAKDIVGLVRSYGIPVWVMEPIRGGRLANVRFDGELQGRNSVEVSFRFLQGIDDVKVTLSGMSNFTQLEENVKTFATEAPLTQAQEAYLFELAREMVGKTLPCTSCRYCTEKCPMGLDIPRLIKIYNADCYSNGGAAPAELSSLADDKKHSACIACRACEAVCPQNIKISEAFTKFAEKMKK